MTAYFDELNRQVSHASVFGVDGDRTEATFLDRVAQIEHRARSASEAVAKLPGFPEDLRRKIAHAIEESLSERGCNYKMLTRSSGLLSALHSIFHEVASRKISTQFGDLSDNPEGTLKRLDANGKDAFDEHLDKCPDCADRDTLGVTGFCEAGEALTKQWSAVNDLMAEGVPPEEYPK